MISYYRITIASEQRYLQDIKGFEILALHDLLSTLSAPGNKMVIVTRSLRRTLRRREGCGGAEIKRKESYHDKQKGE